MLEFIIIFWFIALPVVSYEVELVTPTPPEHIQAMRDAQEKNCKEGNYDNTIERVHLCYSSSK